MSKLPQQESNWLKKRLHLHINILNQSIHLMPSPDVIALTSRECDLLTITTAHQQYCNKHYRDYYGVPLHKFSVWISPEKYVYVPYEEKEELVVVSPDPHPMKEEILNTLMERGLQVTVIQNLTYEAYKLLIGKAKWSLTFGEGLDGYFIEPVFSGAISFAVYNTDFFTPAFRELPGLFSSFEEMEQKLVPTINSVDVPSKYNSLQRQQFNLCASLYSYDTYLQNLRSFYSREYTFK